MERENLTGDAKGKGTSGSNREAESTDAPERGGLLRSSCVHAEAPRPPLTPSAEPLGARFVPHLVPKWDNLLIFLTFHRM
jgi:hypothetical protein